MMSTTGADALLEQGDVASAARACIEEYGPEVLGYLVRALRHEHDAEDAFAQACEDLWANLPRFERRCSLRTWFYTLARHAACRLLRAPHRKHPHIGDSALSDAAERVRSATLPQLQTSGKDWLAKVREGLDEDDRTLLVLRVDRQMSWADVARVFAGPEQEPVALTREEAKLRKRFQVLKATLREYAREYAGERELGD